MKKTNHKRLLTLVLALVLVFALSLGAFAAWNQFQGSNDNNGVISVAPPTSTPTVTEVNLSVNNPYGDVYSGVDAETVMNNGVAYTLYNGGVTNGTAGGARLRATTVSSGACVWDIQLDASADNESQLSTPYLDADGGKLYATVSIRTPIFTDNDAVWTASGDASIDTVTGVATFAAGTGVISTPITISDDVNYLYLPSNLSGTGGTYTIRLMSGGTLYRTLASGYVASWGTFDNYDGTQIAHGAYTLEIEVTGNTAAVTMSQIVINRYDWRLYSVSDLDQPCPTVNMLLGSSSLTAGNINANCEGQITTPIYYDGYNLYFGAYGGTHSYYQYVPGNTSPVMFTPAGNENFYWAGAVKVNDGTHDYIVFGSDSGKVYVRSKTAFGTTGSVIDLSTITPHGQPAVAPGQIRSSMVLYNGKVYFTSKGTGANGWLWFIETAAITNPGSSDVQVKMVMASNVTFLQEGGNSVFSPHGSTFYLNFMMPKEEYLTLVFEIGGQTLTKTYSTGLNFALENALNALAGTVYGYDEQGNITQNLQYRYFIDKVLSKAAQSAHANMTKEEINGIVEDAQTEINAYINGSKDAEIIEVSFNDTLVFVETGIQQSQAFMAAMEQVYPREKGFWYFDCAGTTFGLWVNGFGGRAFTESELASGVLETAIKTPSKTFAEGDPLPTSGLIMGTQKGDMQYNVNGLYSDFGVTGWNISDNEIFSWGPSDADALYSPLYSIDHISGAGAGYMYGDESDETALLWAIAYLHRIGVTEDQLLAKIGMSETETAKLTATELYAKILAEYPDHAARLSSAYL